MLIPFGILSAAGVSGVVPGDYDLISTTILGSAAASVTFSSLGDYSSTYKHLQIRTAIRVSSGSGNNQDVQVRLNADSGANYAIHGLYGNGSSALSYAVTSRTSVEIGTFPTSNFTANVFALAVIDFLDFYSATKNTTIRSFSGFAGGNQVSLRSGLWNNTASVTSILLSENGTGSNFVIGSRFSLYGIKG
jgi:hypothetical protein